MTFDEKARWYVFWAKDIAGGSHVRRYYEKIRSSFLYGTPKDEIDGKVRNLIRHAAATTPFYQKFDPETSLEKMPVITKETVRADYSQFSSFLFRDAPDNRTMYTSGSTGTPFEVVQNKGKIYHNTAASIFLGAVAGYYIGMKVAFIRMWVGDHAKKSRFARIAENLIQVDCANLDDEGIGRIVNMIRKKHVEILIGYAAALTDISRYIDKAGIDTSGFPVRCIIPISEHMAAPVREALSRQFNCPVRSWYCNEENGIMAVQEAVGDRYYVDTESYYYELLKMDSDEPAEPGELGRLVITDLYNYATPLIRYENGDLAVAETIEKNGRIRLLLTELYGRRSDLIYDSKGRSVSPFVLYNGLAMEKSIRQFQFIQEDEAKYTLCLNGDRDAIDVGRILQAIRPYLGEEAEISVEFVDEIPVLASGKRKNIVNRCGKYQ